MSRNANKRHCHAPGCRSWAMRRHGLCRAHLDHRFGRRAADAPRVNLNPVKTGRYAHPVSPAPLQQIAGHNVQEPDRLPQPPHQRPQIHSPRFRQPGHLPGAHGPFHPAADPMRHRQPLRLQAGRLPSDRAQGARSRRPGPDLETRPPIAPSDRSSSWMSSPRKRPVLQKPRGPIGHPIPPSLHRNAGSPPTGHPRHLPPRYKNKTITGTTITGSRVGEPWRPGRPPPSPLL